jgi:hypothetical protein
MYNAPFAIRCIKAMKKIIGMTLATFNFCCSNSKVNLLVLDLPKPQDAEGKSVSCKNLLLMYLIVSNLFETFHNFI